MSRTPETIISKPLKFIHDSLMLSGTLFLVISLIHFAAGGNGFVQLFIAIVLGGLGSKIKFKWVKEVEVGGYRRV